MALNFQSSAFERLSRLLFVVFLVVSIALVGVYMNEGATGPLHAIQTQFHALVSPVQMVGSSADAFVESTGEAVSDSQADPEVLSQLRQQNQELTELLTQGEEYRLEVERLQGLLNMKETYQIEGVSGRVIGRSPDAWDQTITVDVGEADGVKAGLTVLGPSGVIGQVISASYGSCTVRLLTDPQSGVAAIVQSNRAEGIVRGSLNGLLHLENIKEDDVISIGDVVLTSGLGGSFVKGLLIGTVVRVEGSTNDGTRNIIVSQNEEIKTLEEVMVVFSAQETSAEGTPDNTGNANSLTENPAVKSAFNESAQGSTGNTGSNASSSASSSASSNASSSASNQSAQNDDDDDRGQR